VIPAEPVRLTHQNVAQPSRLRVSAASRPDFQRSTLHPRTGTGTVPQLAGGDACATMAPAFLGIVPRQIGCVGPAEPVPFRPGARIEMWRRHSCLRVKAAFQPPVLLEHGTGKSREPAGWKTCATNAALPTHRDKGFKRVSPGSGGYFGRTMKSTGGYRVRSRCFSPKPSGFKIALKYCRQRES